MAGDTLKKVQPGDPLRIPAAAYNAFIDAVEKLKASDEAGAHAGAHAGGINPQKPQPVWAKNPTDYTIPWGHVVSYAIMGYAGARTGDDTEPIVSLQLPPQRSTPPGYGSNEPPGAGKYFVDRIAVAAETIQPQSVGRVYLSGPCLVRVKYYLEPGFTLGLRINKTVPEFTPVGQLTVIGYVEPGYAICVLDNRSGDPGNTTQLDMTCLGTASPASPAHIWDASNPADGYNGISISMVEGFEVNTTTDEVYCYYRILYLDKDGRVRYMGERGTYTIQLSEGSAGGGSDSPPDPPGPSEPPETPPPNPDPPGPDHDDYGNPPPPGSGYGEGGDDWQMPPPIPDEGEHPPDGYVEEGEYGTLWYWDEDTDTWIRIYDDRYYCVASDCVPGSGLEVGDIVTGDFASQADCETSDCLPLYCWSDGQDYQCSRTSPGEGWSIVSGPYTTEGECQAACVAPECPTDDCLTCHTDYAIQQEFSVECDDCPCTAGAGELHFTQDVQECGQDPAPCCCIWHGDVIGCGPPPCNDYTLEFNNLTCTDGNWEFTFQHNNKYATYRLPAAGDGDCPDGTYTLVPGATCTDAPSVLTLT